jgi:hypothetical protein
LETVFLEVSSEDSDFMVSIHWPLFLRLCNSFVYVSFNDTVSTAYCIAFNGGMTGNYAEGSGSSMFDEQSRWYLMLHTAKS